MEQIVVPQIVVPGYVGEAVSIRCDYPEEYADSPKQLCQVGGRCDTLFSQKEEPDSQEHEASRVHLSDFPSEGVFMVNISKLNRGDGGEYNCSVLQPNSTIIHLLKVHLWGE